MRKGGRAGQRTVVSGGNVSLKGGVRSKRGIKRPHSEIFTDLIEGGAEGANGWREQ